jgi:8-oxo-dGTP pyrophosphatase MutT (NUDIX family)
MVRKQHNQTATRAKKQYGKRKHITTEQSDGFTKTLPKAKTRFPLETPLKEKDHEPAKPEHRTLYVLTFVRPTTGFMGSYYTYFVRKPKGSLHEGRLNLPGGKVEKGEKPHVAAVRELYEETGIHGMFPQYMGALRDVRDDWSVLVYTVNLDPVSQGKQVRYDHNVHEVYRLDINDKTYRSQMLPNLPLILALCATNTRGWDLYDECDFSVTPEHYAGSIAFHPPINEQRDQNRTPKSNVGIAR